LNFGGAKVFLYKIKEVSSGAYKNVQSFFFFGGGGALYLHLNIALSYNTLVTTQYNNFIFFIL